ncbi:MAG: hypothetical protein ACOYOT_09195 [Bacteroidales bacterium]
MKAKQMRNGLLAPLFLVIFTACAIPFETATSSRPAVRVVYDNPAWAPTYYGGVRYYYFPDLEVYYDLQNRDFVYLSDGRWLFSRELPPFYSDYDLYHSYVISLNVNVFQPWRHHHFYISNYPRYYYRNYYKHDRDYDGIRGFNENDRHPIYRPDYRRGDANEGNHRYNTDKGGYRDRDGINNRDSRGNDDRFKNNRNGNESTRNEQTGNTNANNRDSRYTGTSNDRNDNSRTTRYDSGSPKNEQTVPKTDGGRDSRYTRDSQEPNYYGKRIGKPVTVESQMREPKSDGRSTGGRR